MSYGNFGIKGIIKAMDDINVKFSNPFNEYSKLRLKKSVLHFENGTWVFIVFSFMAYLKIPLCIFHNKAAAGFRYMQTQYYMKKYQEIWIK